MERINKAELEALVNKPTETTPTVTRLSRECLVVLAGMLHMAASQAKTQVTASESAMWARQIQGFSPEVIEQFFTEWMATSHYMPAFSDWTEWIEARSERINREQSFHEYKAYELGHAEEVRQWRESPEYERDMQAIREKLQSQLNRAEKVKTAPQNEIPLAFSPEAEKEIIANFIAKKGQQ